MPERVAEIFGKSSSWRMNRETEMGFEQEAFRESDLHPNHVLDVTSWRKAVALGFHLLLDTAPVVVGHSILPIALDDSCSMVNNLVGSILRFHFQPWAMY